MEAVRNEIRRLHRACRSKDVIINSACDIIIELVEKLNLTPEQKKSYLDEVAYFQENVG